MGISTLLVNNKAFLLKKLCGIVGLILIGFISNSYAQGGVVGPAQPIKISADKAVGGDDESYSSLLGIGVQQIGANGFPLDATDRQFYIDLPEHWVFNTEAGEVNIYTPPGETSMFYNVSVEVTSSRATVTYSTTATATIGSRLTMDGLQIKSLQPRNISETGSFLKIGYPAGSGINSIASGSNIGTLIQTSGLLKSLLVLLPGESYTQSLSSTTGKIGVPDEQIAGRPFNVNVIAVDKFFNKVSYELDEFNNEIDLNHEVALSSSGAGFLSNNFNLTRGEGTASVINSIAGNYTVTGQNVTEPTITNGVSDTYIVTKSTFAKLQVILPGENYLFNAVGGKTGTPTGQVAGVNFLLTVNALDNYNVLDETISGPVEVLHTGFNGTVPVTVNLVNGTGSVNVNSSTSGNIVFTANYPANLDITNGSSMVEVASNSYTKILAFFEGQSHVPGSLTGISGSPIIPDRSELVELTLLAVDNQFNLVSNIGSLLTFEPDDENVFYDEEGSISLQDVTVNYENGTYLLKFYLDDPAVHSLAIRDSANDIFTTVNVPLPTVQTIPSDYFRTVKSGNWNDRTVWENSSDNITWTPATLTPSTAASAISIRAGHTVNVNSNVGNIEGNDSSFIFLIEEGGVMNVLGANQISLSKTEIRGTLVSNGEFGSASTRVFETGVFTLNSNNTLFVPVATWDAGSICNITGITNKTGEIIGIGGRTLSTLNFNNPGLIGNVHFTGGALNITNLNVISTGTGTLRLINGALSATDSSIDNVNIVNGRLSLNNSTFSGAIHYLNLKSLEFQNGIITKEGTTGATLIFNTTSPAFTIGTSAMFSSVVNISFIPNSTINLGVNEFKGSSGSFTIANNSIVRSAHPQGLSTSGSTGNVQFTTRVFPNTAGTGMTYHFNGESLQNIGDLVSNTFIPTLIIDNAVGAETAALTGISFTHSNLEIRQGYFNIGSKRLIATVPFTGNGELRTQSTNSAPIPSGLTWTGTIHLSGANQSVVSGTYHHLKLSGGGKTLAGNISITGNFDVSGVTPSTVNTGTRKVIYSGTDNQNVAGLSYYDLDVSGSGTKTITTAATVSNNVNVSGATLNANGNLTLLATESKNANIAAITGGGAVIGNVKVPVIITGGVVVDRGVRTLSTPINDNTSAKNTLAHLKDFIPLMGMAGHVGLDEVPRAAFTSSYISKYIETRDYSVSPYNFVNNINDKIQPGEGFQIYFTGNRTNLSNKVTPPYANPETVTVIYEGVINQGTINRAITNSAIGGDPHNGRNLVGNPYPATLDADLFIEANSSKLANTTIYTVRKNKATATYNLELNSGANGGSRYIRPGQAFYILAQNNASLVFEESFKHSGNNFGNVSVMNAKTDRIILEGELSEVPKSRTVTSSVNPVRKMKLKLSNTEAEEEAVIAFSESFTDEYDQKDSKYFSSDVRTILSSYTSDGEETTFNLMNDIKDTKEVKVKVNAAVSGPVKLKFEEIDNFEYIDIFIKDSFVGSEVQLDKENPEYNFVLDRGQNNSYGANRISVKFIPNKTLPIINQTLKLEKDQNKIILRFTASDNSKVEKYIVERSGGNGIFEEIGTVMPESLSMVFNDYKPLNGTNYYRIKAVYEGRIDLSTVKSIDFSISGNKIKLYPNPTSEQIFVSSTDDSHNRFNYVIANVAGVNIKRGVVANADEGIFVADLTAGIYFIELRKENGEFVDRLKFVKK